MLHANFTALSSTEPDSSLTFYIAEQGILRFCSRDLDLDPMTFIYELDPYRLKMYP